MVRSDLHGKFRGRITITVSFANRTGNKASGGEQGGFSTLYSLGLISPARHV